MGKEQKAKELRKELGYKPGLQTNYRTLKHPADEDGNIVVTRVCVGKRATYLSRKKEL